MSMVLREELSEGIKVITLNRPESLNALSPALFSSLIKSSQNFQTKLTQGCVILRGAGRCFSAGNAFKSSTKRSKGKRKIFQA